MTDCPFFDGQAVATIISGVLASIAGGGAIFAAWKVGHGQIAMTSRQAEIADNQTTILSKQTALDENRLKWQLFDRRFKIYRDIRMYLISLKNNGFSIEIEPFRAYTFNLDEARFIFSREVYVSLHTQLNELTDHYSSIKEASDNAYDEADRLAYEEQFEDWVTETLGNFHQIFEADLRLANFYLTS